MPGWFFSYHSPDEALASGLKAAVERQDSSARVFFAPTHLRAGGSWSAQLSEQIASADVFLLLVGPRGIGPWQVLEYDEALDRWVKEPSTFPLVVVLLEGQTAPGLPFLRRLHWIITPDPTSERDVARLLDAAAGRGVTPSEPWRHASPYRGLEAMEEADSAYFFGRSRETVEVLQALEAPDRLPILIGNSGVGKSSLAKAGVLAALKRQGWPDMESGRDLQSKNWPQVFANSRKWCFLVMKPGAEPIKALVDVFLDSWQFSAADPERLKYQHGWIDLLRGGKATLSDLIDATARRCTEFDQPEPPAFLLYVDQGEELYVRADAQEGRCFSGLISKSLCDPRLRTMMSLRSDFLGFLQGDGPLFESRRQIDVPPLREAALHEVVARPAQLLGAHFESDHLIGIITQRATEDSIKDVGSLPLLSYTLDDMWTEMVKRGDGLLRLPAQSFELSGVLVDRANDFLARHPTDEAALRRILTLRCATVREAEEPTRRRAARDEFSDNEWRLVSELAGYPNRLLVTISMPAGGVCAEVAHEAIFRRWSKLRDWITAEREFLAWRSTLEAARKAWENSTNEGRGTALLMGAALAKAEKWLNERSVDLLPIDRTFIEASIVREKRARAGIRRLQLTAFVSLIVIIIGLIGVIGQAWIGNQYRSWVTEPFHSARDFRPYVLATDREQALEAGHVFRECAKNCPEMVVAPPGTFWMGAGEKDSNSQPDELPRHKVKIAKSFAVGRYDVTFDDWEDCVRYGDCPSVSDGGYGKGRQPVINVSWSEARAYAAWLSRMTGKTYRLVTEAEWEYAARAGTTTEYYWGDGIGKRGQIQANCSVCGTQWDAKKPSPVGAFAPNPFGLYDMVGNVFQWVADCYHPNYGTGNDPKAPDDGSIWITGDCNMRVVRGGSWLNGRTFLRSADRLRTTSDGRDGNVGFRLARTLAPN